MENRLVIILPRISTSSRPWPWTGCRCSSCSRPSEAPSTEPASGIITRPRRPSLSPSRHAKPSFWMVTVNEICWTFSQSNGSRCGESQGADPIKIFWDKIWIFARKWLIKLVMRPIFASQSGQFQGRVRISAGIILIGLGSGHDPIKKIPA